MSAVTGCNGGHPSDGGDQRQPKRTQIKDNDLERLRCRPEVACLGPKTIQVIPCTQMAEIVELAPSSRWIPTALNVADDVTRAQEQPAVQPRERSM